jgi:hypothetical protein
MISKTMLRLELAAAAVVLPSNTVCQNPRGFVVEQNMDGEASAPYCSGHELVPAPPHVAR